MHIVNYNRTVKNGDLFLVLEEENEKVMKVVDEDSLPTEMKSFYASIQTLNSI